MRALVVTMSAAGLLVVAASGCATQERVVRTEPAPSATIVTAAPGTTVVTVPGAAVAPCEGAWTPAAGTNFGDCPK